ncbi:MAG: C69 family dipeptidase [Proteobacteria bacterium]|nr:C69 family dipeptidase [Pseudomonadota bacterium]
MCDTMVAGGDAVAAGGVLFAKNSDRERNEAQYLEYRPRQKHRAGSPLKLTHVSIEAAAATHAVLLSRPFWIWGAEMGANEHGVVIGNEAVYSKLAPSKKPGVIGMDLLRLGLERGASAAEALEVITGLIERHGQGGNCGHLRQRSYHNSFIIADPSEAWVLETVGRYWVAERAVKVRTISNALSIGTRFTSISAALPALIGRRGWDGESGPINVASAITNARRDRLSEGHERRARSTGILAERNRRLSASDMIQAVRDHGQAGADPDWRPDEEPNRTLCMHGSWGLKGGQTVGSLVSDLRPGRIVHWVTGSAAPCTSIFKPVFFDAMPDFGPRPTDRFNPRTRWWRHERLHRLVIEDYGPRLALIRQERDQLEERFRKRVAAALASGGGSVAQARRDVVRTCWAEADAAEARWFETLHAVHRERPSQVAVPYRRAWNRMARLAAIPAF